MLLRAGQMIGSEKISDISYMPAYESNSGQAALTDANVWTAYVLFTDGNSAVVTGVVPVPEPGVGVVAGIVLLAAAHRRTRRIRSAGGRPRWVDPTPVAR
jgi:hypothetical protein